MSNEKSQQQEGNSMEGGKTPPSKGLWFFQYPKIDTKEYADKLIKESAYLGFFQIISTMVLAAFKLVNLNDPGVLVEVGVVLLCAVAILLDKFKFTSVLLLFSLFTLDSLIFLSDGKLSGFSILIRLSFFSIYLSGLRSCLFLRRTE